MLCTDVPCQHGLVHRAGESITHTLWWRHHVTACAVFLSCIVYVVFYCCTSPVRLTTVGVPSFQRQHCERLFVSCHICTAQSLDRGLQTASQDFPLFAFLPEHPYMTYLLLLLIIIVVFFTFFLAFTVNLTITDSIQATLNVSMMTMM